MKTGIAAVAAVTLLAAGCGERPALLRVIDARHRAAEALIQFTRASDATNRAVMAVTDRQSSQFADEARQARAAVKSDVDALAPLLQGLDFAKEASLLEEFQKNFAEYVKLDDTILGLAVENSNIKARALAFGPGREAADAVRNELDRLAPDRGADNWQIRSLAASTLASVFELQALQGPHIEESTDATMDELESRMAAAEARGRTALGELNRLVPPASRSRAAAATVAFERFIDVNRQVVELSRRNTNVRSLALVMEDKGMRTSACERALRALADALNARTSSASR